MTRPWTLVLCWFVVSGFRGQQSTANLIASPSSLDLHELTVGFLSGIVSKESSRQEDEERIILSDGSLLSKQPQAALLTEDTEKEHVATASESESLEHNESAISDTLSKENTIPKTDPVTPRLMRGSRVVGKKNKDKFLALPRTDGGRVKCRWCSKAVMPPRRTFCSADCVHEYRLRTDQNYIRSCVLDRDKGICALCGRNAHALYVAAVSFACDTAIELSTAARARVLKLAMSRRRKHADKKMLVLILNASSTVHGATGLGEVEAAASSRKKKKGVKSLSAMRVADLRAMCATLALREWTEVPRRTAAEQAANATSASSAAIPNATSTSSAAIPSFFQSDAEGESNKITTHAGDAAAPFGATIWHVLQEEQFVAAVNALTGAKAVSAGHFWQADHILPVAEGGGQCCLGNLRTLCTPCHASCTRQLRLRLAAGAARRPQTE